MIEGESLGEFIEEPSEETPMPWYGIVAVVAFIVGGAALRFWFYSGAPDWLVRALGFLGF